MKNFLARVCEAVGKESRRIDLCGIVTKTVFLFAVFVVTYPAVYCFAGIAETSHNLTATGGGTRVTDPSVSTCALCHIPHGGVALPGKPLWAKAESGTSGTPVIYKLYGKGSTLSGTTVNPPGSSSLSCLSCHDGTIGLATVTKYGVTTSYAMTTNLPGGLSPTGAFQPINVNPVSGYSPYVGTDLMNVHPVGFAFPAGGYTGGGVPGISLTVVNGGTPDAHLQGVTGAQYPLFQSGDVNNFECPSCHDPHLPPVAGQTRFLRAPNALICQDCHNVK